MSGRLESKDGKNGVMMHEAVIYLKSDMEESMDSPSTSRQAKGKISGTLPSQRGPKTLVELPTMN